MSSYAKQVPSLTYEEFISVLSVNVIVCTACMIAFCILRNVKTTKFFYAPLYYRSSEEHHCTHTENPMPPHKPDVPSPGNGLFSWISSTLKFKDDALLATRGLDAVMHVRTMRLMIVILASYSLFSLGILLPINKSADWEPQILAGNTTQFDVTGIGALSIGNLPDEDRKMYAHAIMTIFFTLLGSYFLYKEYERYLQYRIQYHTQNAAHNYTVMVKSVPPFIRSAEQLESFFHRLYDGKVLAAHMPLTSNKLRKLLKQRKDASLDLERVRALQQQNSMNPIVYISGGCCMKRKADAMEHCEHKLAEIDKLVQAERSRTFGQRHEPVEGVQNIGFVTFKSAGDANLCAQSVIHPDVKTCRPRLAPQKDDLYWDHLTRTTHRSYTTLHVLSLVFFFFLIALWSSFTFFLSSIGNLDALAKIRALAWLAKILEVNSFLAGLIQNYLPALGLVIVQALLPAVIKGVLKLRGDSTRSHLEKSVTKVYFFFLVVNVFFVYAISGSIFSILGQILNQSLLTFVEALGPALSNQAATFVSYLVVYSLSSLPQSMLRLWPLIRTSFNKKRAVTKCDKWHAMKPEYPQYGLLYANSLLIFLISVVFSTVSPFILPFGIFALFMEFLVTKYKHMYTTPQRFHSGAYFWPIVFNRMVCAYVIFHITMFGILSLKKSTSAFIILPLPIFSFLFARFCRRRFLRPSKFLPVTEFPYVTNPDDRLGNPNQKSINSQGVAEDDDDMEKGHLMACVDDGTGEGEKFVEMYRDPALAEDEVMSPGSERWAKIGQNWGK